MELKHVKMKFPGSSISKNFILMNLSWISGNSTPTEVSSSTCYATPIAVTRGGANHATDAANSKHATNGASFFPAPWDAEARNAQASTEYHKQDGASRKYARNDAKLYQGDLTCLTKTFVSEFKTIILSFKIILPFI